MSYSRCDSIQRGRHTFVVNDLRAVVSVRCVYWRDKCIDHARPAWIHAAGNGICVGELLMTQTDVVAATVLVADAHPSDYIVLAPMVEAGQLDIHFFASAKAVLRAAEGLRYDLWFINVRLPDMDGFELLDMLSCYRDGKPVFVVADSYAAQAELNALRLGATKFLCKPLDPAWLADLRFKRAPAPTLSAQTVATGLTVRKTL
jgi:CheY-like chemotaxis protein